MCQIVYIPMSYLKDNSYIGVIDNNTFLRRKHLYSQYDCYIYTDKS